MRRFALVVTSHRGDLYLPGSLKTWLPNLPWDDMHPRVLHDDGGGAGLSRSSDAFGSVGVVPPEQRRGLAGSVNCAWGMAGDVDFVFHLEEDFHLTAPVDLDAMADVVERDGLAQMVLYRQPWSPSEQAAGGYMQADPGAYEQRAEYVFHRECFSLNPCLIPADVIRAGWPGGNEAEQTERFRERGFGVWGQLDDPPRCLHVGNVGGMGSPGWAA